MCLIAFAWDPTGPQTLLAAANRDEFYARPTLAADWWTDAPDIWAGRDLSAGGTWLGITRSGRFAALTNYRQMGTHDPEAPSRGHLVAAFLGSNDDPGDYLGTVAESAADFNGFNLLVGTLASLRPELWYLGHRPGAVDEPPRALEAGVYGLSNALLDTPWPKLVRTTAGLTLLKAAQADVPAFLSLMSDTTVADDPDLPSTGLPLDRERLLSAAFIISPNYGTRSQTVLDVRGGSVHALERSFSDAHQAGTMTPSSVRRTQFQIPNADLR